MKEIIIALIGSGILSTLITVITGRIAQKGRTDKDVRHALKMLLYDQLKEEAQRLISAGEAEAEELEGWSEAFEAYKALGGDGFIDTLCTRVSVLPITKNDSSPSGRNTRAAQMNMLLDYNG